MGICRGLQFLSVHADGGALVREACSQLRADLAGKGHEAFRKAYRDLRDDCNDDRVRMVIWIRPGVLASQILLGGEDKTDSSGFPRGVRRVLQPHGIDVPLHNSIIGYGAGTVFDYVLCPSLGPHLQGSLVPELHRGIFPPGMVEHGSAELAAAGPSGLPGIRPAAGEARGRQGRPR